MMLPRSMKFMTGRRIFHTATVRAFQSTAKKSLTIPFLPVLPQKPGGVRGTPNDAYVPPPENKLEGSYHWYMEKIFALSVVPLATTAMLTTGPLSTAADSFFSVMLLGYCYMAVSYTHLDVYKRQHLDIVKTLFWVLHKLPRETFHNPNGTFIFLRIVF